jgi:hypothetical protein
VSWDAPTPAAKPAPVPVARVTAADVLDLAKATVTGPRADAYGSAAQGFGVTAEMWSAYLRRRCGLGSDLEPADVAALVALLKLSRLAGNLGHADSWLDLAGYAALGAEVSA